MGRTCKGEVMLDMQQRYYDSIYGFHCHFEE